MRRCDILDYEEHLRNFHMSLAISLSVCQLARQTYAAVEDKGAMQIKQKMHTPLGELNLGKYLQLAKMGWALDEFRWMDARIRARPPH